MGEHRTDILLQSGNFFDFTRTSLSTITIEDIAHGLSNESRYNGQTSDFYSVAQHSVWVSLLVPPEHAMAALLHDCSEAVMKDIPKPLKRLLPDYCALEKKVEEAILAKFGIDADLHPSIKKADVIMLATEKRDLMPPNSGYKFDCVGFKPISDRIIPMEPRAAKAWFLERYHELLALQSSQPCATGAWQA